MFASFSVDLEMATFLAWRSTFVDLENQRVGSLSELRLVQQQQWFVCFCLERRRLTTALAAVGRGVSRQQGTLTQLSPWCWLALAGLAPAASQC